MRRPASVAVLLLAACAAPSTGERICADLAMPGEACVNDAALASAFRKAAPPEGSSQAVVAAFLKERFVKRDPWSRVEGPDAEGSFQLFIDHDGAKACSESVRVDFRFEQARLKDIAVRAPCL